ncbi:MAG: hypothetical protein HWD58_07705 [Bacteroidota bacterium]|nr:MAG: hypothetical protein HWD58_07705 [Bacteroidota bacterium]
MDNGDSLVPPNAYNHTVFPTALYTQSSLILPKGSNGEFYVFICTITDAKYNYWNTNPLGDGRSHTIYSYTIS